MATAASALVARTRRFVRDYPDNDALTVSLTASGTTATVASSALYQPGVIIEIDSENLYVASLASATTLTVRRGVRGSTAASHVNASAVLVRPAFFAAEILDALNGAQYDAYPVFYKPVIDESLTGDGTTYEFTVPNMTGTYDGATIVIPYLSKVFTRVSGQVPWAPTQRWEVIRGATPKIKFREPPLSGEQIRITGYGPFTDFVATTDTVDTLMPKRLERSLHLYAASELLASGEAGRVRQDTGARDQRESANRTGSSLSLSNSLYGRWRAKLLNQPMPSLPPHVISVI